MNADIYTTIENENTNTRSYESEGLRNNNRLFYGWTFDMEDVLIDWGL